MPSERSDAGRPRVSGSTRFRIGDWTVEPALNRLSAPGKSARVEPKAMAVLVCLAGHAGEVVSREALLEAAWPGLVVSDDAVTQVVIKLRKALGGGPGEPAYIETIPKGGYRLIAPVTPAPDEAPAPRSRLRPVWLAAGGLAAVVVVGAMLGWFATERAGTAGPAPAKPTPGAALPLVMVRTFASLSEDPRADLLARGITADLVTDLSKVSGLLVASEVPEQDRAESVLPIGTSGAQYVVSGSVQLTGQGVSLHVDLAEGESGVRVWSERFDRPLADLFTLQEELAPKILQKLPARISKAELERVAHRYTRNLEAYERFQRGEEALQVRQPAENQAARALFRQAIALDAGFGRAYAALALTYCADYRNQWTADGRAALARASELVKTASDLSPDNPEIFWVQAFVHMERGENEKALKFLEESVRLYPSYADSYALMGSITTYLGRPAQSVVQLHTAMRLNPRASQLYFLNLGRAYLFLGDLEQARVNLDEAISRNPANLESHVYMAALELAAGDHAAAEWQANEIHALRPNFSGRKWMETYPMIDQGQRKRLLVALQEIGL